MSKPAKGDMKTDGAQLKTTKATKATKAKPDAKANDAIATVRQRFLLSADALAALVDKLAAAGTPAVAPAWTADGTTDATDATGVSCVVALATFDGLPTTAFVFSVPRKATTAN